MQSRAPPMGSPNQGIGDHHEDEEEQGGHCFQAIDSGRSSFWMMRVLRTVACQGTHMRSRGDPLLQSVGGAAATVREVLRQPYHHYYYNNNFSTSSPQLHFRPALSPDHARFNPMNPRMKDLYTNPLSRMDDSNAELARAGAGCCASSRASVDGLSSDTQSVSFGEFSFENRHDDDTSSSSDVSSPLGWPLGASPKSNPEDSSLTMKSYGGSLWEERRRMRDMDLPEAELMKERFAKLLLGEDMSGGGKGVCTALAISNAITNLSACVFGEIWRLEPLPSKYRSLWRREMEWLVSVSDYMIEMLPSQQALPDGSTLEVMITRPRSDLQINIPALRKLDDMLLECLDSFHETDFWYDDQSSVEDDHTGQKVMIPQQEKWWLPLPKVPINGISEESRKGLQHQKECVNQILKATMAINNQILVDMDVPDAYWEALPKNGRASLGEDIYKKTVSDHFSAEALLCSLDISTEHKALEIANRLEASIHLWRERGSKQAQNPGKDAHLNNKGSWGKLRSLVTDIERRELLARRSENILFCLKQRFPGLPQTLLDITKIQFNKDVGQSILESYSRVLESLAFNIMARIDDVLYVDDMAKSPVLPLSGKASLGFTSSLHVSPIPTPAAQSLTPTPLPSPGRSLC